MNTLPIEIVDKILIESNNLVYAVSLNCSLYVYNKIIDKLIENDCKDEDLSKNFHLLVKYTSFKNMQKIIYNYEFGVNIICKFIELTKKQSDLEYKLLEIILSHNDSYEYFKVLFQYIFKNTDKIDIKYINIIFKHNNVHIIEHMFKNIYFLQNTKNVKNTKNIDDLCYNYTIRDDKYNNQNKKKLYYANDNNQSLKYYSYNPYFLTTSCCMSNLEVVKYVYNYILNNNVSDIEDDFLDKILINIYTFMSKFYHTKKDVLEFTKSKIIYSKIDSKEYIKFEKTILYTLNNKNLNISDKYLQFMFLELNIVNIPRNLVKTCIKNNCNMTKPCIICYDSCYNCINYCDIKTVQVDNKIKKCSCKIKCSSCGIKTLWYKLNYPYNYCEKRWCYNKGLCKICFEDFSDDD